MCVAKVMSEMEASGLLQSILEEFASQDHACCGILDQSLQILLWNFGPEPANTVHMGAVGKASSYLVSEFANSV